MSAVNDQPRADLVTQVRITFGTVGRTKPTPRTPEPLDVPLGTDDEMEDVIVPHVWTYLASQDVWVTFDWDAMTGEIKGGIRTVGTFTMEHVSPEAYL